MSDPIHYYLNLDQIEQLRDAAYAGGTANPMRNEVLVVVMADFGLRVSEAVQLRKSHFDFKGGYLELPASIQKDYPVEGKSPRQATLEIDPYGHFGTQRLLKQYFASEWWQAQDGDHLFPSRQSDQISPRSGRNIIEDLALRGEVAPRSTGDEPTTPEDMHPHALRHSVACYALRDEDTRLIDVRNRLRHRSIRTTEDIYEHFQPR